MTVWKQAALACLCATLAVWWWAQRYGERPQTLAGDHPPTLTVTHATAYRYDAQGARQDTLQADTVQYYHDGRDTHFIRPVLRRETENGHLHGQSQEAHMLADGTIHFRGDVLMQRFQGGQEKMAVRSPSMDYDPAAQILSSQEDVDMTSPESRTQSRGAIWQLERQYLILQENVRSRYVPNRPR